MPCLYITYSSQADKFGLIPPHELEAILVVNSCEIRDDVTVFFKSESLGTLIEIIILGIREPRDKEWSMFVRHLLGETVWQKYQEFIVESEGIEETAVFISSDELDTLEEAWTDCHRQVREQLRL